MALHRWWREVTLGWRTPHLLQFSPHSMFQGCLVQRESTSFLPSYVTWGWGGLRRLSPGAAPHWGVIVMQICKWICRYHQGSIQIPYLSNSAWFYLCSEEFLFSIAKVENAQARTHQLKTKESGEINADEMQLRSDPKKIKSESWNLFLSNSSAS